MSAALWCWKPAHSDVLWEQLEAHRMRRLRKQSCIFDTISSDAIKSKFRRRTSEMEIQRLTSQQWTMHACIFQYELYSAFGVEAIVD